MKSRMTPLSVSMSQSIKQLQLPINKLIVMRINSHNGIPKSVDKYTTHQKLAFHSSKDDLVTCPGTMIIMSP